MEGGVYEVTDLILEHSIGGANGVTHPANLGPTLARRFAEANGGRAFVVNPPDTDELCGAARMTGIHGVYRHVHLHALNLKETGHPPRGHPRAGAYEDCDFVVCHIGGGISISAHQHGRMIDGNDIVGGEGPMAPTRAGAVPVVEVLDYLETGHSVAETRRLCMKTGGFESLVGTSDAIQIIKRADEGDVVANACLGRHGLPGVQGDRRHGSRPGRPRGRHPFGRRPGLRAAPGGVHSPEVRLDCSRHRLPGEFEMEAMAGRRPASAFRRRGAKTYTGVPSLPASLTSGGVSRLRYKSGPSVAPVATQQAPLVFVTCSDLHKV